MGYNTTMKVILIATITADGYTARDAHHLVDWSSKTDKGTFVKLTREMGVIVMGANSFGTIQRDLSTHNRRVIVYTRHPDRVDTSYAETTSEEPEALLKRLEAEGVTGVAICGGTQIYTMFMKAGLIDDLYIVSEPVIIGSGLTLFDEPMNMRIELFESTIRRGHSVVNHFRVLKDQA